MGVASALLRCSKGWSYIPAHTDGIMWTPWDLKQKEHRELGGK